MFATHINKSLLHRRLKHHRSENSCAEVLETSQRQRGAVFVLVMILMVVLIGFGALTIDLGVMYNTKGDLQNLADACALAAAQELSYFGNDHQLQNNARQAAREVAQRNTVLGHAGDFRIENADIEFLRANFVNGKYEFTPTSVLPDAVRVTAKKQAGHSNGSVDLFFAAIFGETETNITASATALLVPRDISLVVDLSGSHNDDSELPDGNLYAVWDAFPTPPKIKGNNGVGNGLDPPPPGNPNSENDGEGTGPGNPGNKGGNDDPGADPTGGNNALDGPAWGYMSYVGWGDDNEDGGWNASSDPGLVQMRRSYAWTDGEMVDYLDEVGYNTQEIEAIMGYYSRDTDGGSPAWPWRPAVALGLAYWNSGMGPDPDDGELPFWQKKGFDQVGNGNQWLSRGETEWLATFGDRTLDESESLFTSWINGQRSESYYIRERYGIKTFVNWMMKNRYKHTQVPEFAETPHQPMQAVKDAAMKMVEVIEELETDDQVSLEGYGTTAYNLVDLTFFYDQILNGGDCTGYCPSEPVGLNNMQAGHYDNYTNMGGGIQRAIDTLTSDMARQHSRKVMILLTDGMANVNAWGGRGDYNGGRQYALSKANDAVSEGIRIFAVSVGEGADTNLMQQIAEIGYGTHFHASGNMDNYEDELMAIFQALGSQREYQLVE